MFDVYHVECIMRAFSETKALHILAMLKTDGDCKYSPEAALLILDLAQSVADRATHEPIN